jgi:hypothetical protein
MDRVPEFEERDKVDLEEEPMLEALELGELRERAFKFDPTLERPELKLLLLPEVIEGRL